MSRILFCCINGNGLGHVTRILALIRQVRKIDSCHEILVLTSSEFTHILAKENIASVKVPSPEIHRENKKLPVAYLTQSIASQVVATFRPNAVVIDSTPSGLCGEYMSFLNIIPKRAFLFGMFPNFIKTPQYKSSLNFFGKIFMPYTKSEREAVKIKIDNRFEWVGHFLIRSRKEMLSREDARKKMRLSMNETIGFISLGGGGNPENERILNWALSTLTKQTSVKIVCPIQPLARDPSLILDNQQCVPISHFPLIEYYRAFDFAISSGGMNAIAELTHAALPCALVPLGHPSTDQEFNINLFARQGLGIPVKTFDTKALESAIETLLNKKKREQMQQLQNKWTGGLGAENAAKSLIEFINS